MATSHETTHLNPQAASTSTARASSMVGPFSPVLQANFVVREIASSINGQTYQVMIQLPPTYNYTDKPYPVLYALDAEFLFGMQVQIPFMLNQAKEIPEFIIVGPAYGASTKNRVMATRLRDYTPTPNQNFPRSGGGGDFLRFLQTELMPFIETHFRAKSMDRTLWGYSFGGLFGLYALFTTPELFKRYLITSPSIWWDNEVILAMEEAYASRRSDLPAHVFTTQGSLEPEELYQRPWKLLLERLRSRNYEHFELTARTLAGHTHFSTPAPSYVEGLMALFNAKPNLNPTGLHYNSLTGAGS